MPDTPQPCINRTAAQALAHYIHTTIRPDWHPTGLTHHIGQAATTTTNPTHLAIAAINAANTPTNRTPAVIPLPGPHWPTPEAGDPRVARPARPCEDHPTFEAHNCRCCLADVKVGDRPRDRVGLRLVSQVVPQDGPGSPVVASEGSG